MQYIYIGILFIIFFSLWGFYLAIRPFKIVSSVTPASFGLSYEKVTFKTKDNITIHGWFIPNQTPKAKTLILLHGYPADKGNILPAKLFLHKNYNLFLMDFRYLGESEGFLSTVGKDEVLDVLAAIHFLKQRGINEVGIWGFSMGGAVAIMAAEKSPAIKAVIAQSSYAELMEMSNDYFRIPLLKYPLAIMLRFWGWLFLRYDLKEVSPVTSASHLSIPVLIIHSRNDDVISFKHAELFKKHLENKSNVQFLFLDNMNHGEQSPQLQKIEEEFFKKHFNNLK